MATEAERLRKGHIHRMHNRSVLILGLALGCANTDPSTLVSGALVVDGTGAPARGEWLPRVAFWLRAWAAREPVSE